MNLRPTTYQIVTLTGLSYTPKIYAEGGGIELPLAFTRQRLSKPSHFHSGNPPACSTVFGVRIPWLPYGDHLPWNWENLLDPAYVHPEAIIADD